MTVAFMANLIQSSGMNQTMFYVIGQLGSLRKRGERGNQRKERGIKKGK
jgi:hypothetical protein